MPHLVLGTLCDTVLLLYLCKIVSLERRFWLFDFANWFLIYWYFVLHGRIIAPLFACLIHPECFNTKHTSCSYHLWPYANKLLTSHWRQELRVCGGLEEQQVSSERHRLSEHTVTQLQQDRNATLNWTTSFVAAATGLDLHLAYSAGCPVSCTVGLVNLKSQFQCVKRLFSKRDTLIIVMCRLSVWVGAVPWFQTPWLGSEHWSGSDNRIHDSTVRPVLMRSCKQRRTSCNPLVWRKQNRKCDISKQNCRF